LKTPDTAFEATPIRERATLATEFVPENHHFILLAKYLSHWFRDPFPGLELVGIDIHCVEEVGMTSDLDHHDISAISAVRVSDLLRRSR